MLKTRDCSSENELYGLYARLCFVWQRTRRGMRDYLTRPRGGAPRRIGLAREPDLVSLRTFLGRHVAVPNQLERGI
jgi:hypothetical protein